MPHETTLIATIAAGLVLAFLVGFIAARLRLPPLVGYLLAGIAGRPVHARLRRRPGHWPTQLAEIGVILLMFGVGLHFSVDDLLAVRRIAVPARSCQIAVATRWALRRAIWGWTLGAGLVFGLALSVASTVVLLRALEERKAARYHQRPDRRRLADRRGPAMVLALVLLPALAGVLGGDTAAASAAAGRRQPARSTLAAHARQGRGVRRADAGRRAARRAWLLARSRAPARASCSRCRVLAHRARHRLRLGRLFGVSFALGAFFAGMVLSEIEFSHAPPTIAAAAGRVRGAVLRLGRHAVRPGDPGARAAARCWPCCAIIVVGKSLAAFAHRAARSAIRCDGADVSASLAQIGEFSFILAGLGVIARPAAARRARA